MGNYFGPYIKLCLFWWRPQGPAMALEDLQGRAHALRSRQGSLGRGALNFLKLRGPWLLLRPQG